MGGPPKKRYSVSRTRVILSASGLNVFSGTVAVGLPLDSFEPSSTLGPWLFLLGREPLRVPRSVVPNGFGYFYPRLGQNISNGWLILYCFASGGVAPPLRFVENGSFRCRGPPFRTARVSPQCVSWQGNGRFCG